MEKDYYSIFGFSDEERNLQGSDFQKLLKKKFREFSKKYHPDRLSGKSDSEKKEAEEKFKEITDAYNTLSDDNKRREYDMQFSNPFGSGFDPFSDFNPFNVFERGSRHMNKGDDIRITLNISLEEAYNGIKKEIEYEVDEQCHHCHGTGSDDGKKHACPYCHGTGVIQNVRTMGNARFMSQSPCQHCHGTGQVVQTPCKTCNGSGFEKHKKKTTIEVPGGIFNNATLKMSGYGNPSTSNGMNGDLYIVVNIMPHSTYDLDDNGNLMYTLNMNIYDAFNGSKQVIPCLNGTQVQITTNPMVRDGDLLRVSGKGMKRIETNGYGDMYIKIKYIMPTSLTDEQKKLLKRFVEIEDEK